MYEAIASNKRRSVLLLFVFVLVIAGIGYVFGMYSELGEWAVLPAHGNSAWHELGELLPLRQDSPQHERGKRITMSSCPS